MKYRNIILLLTQRLILKRHEIALRVLYIVRELLVLVVRASMRDNLAHVYCATSRRNQSLILSLVVRNINHVPILKRHGHCVPHNAGTCNRNGNKRRNGENMTALFFVPAIVFHPSPSTGFSLLHNSPYQALRVSVLAPNIFPPI